MIEILVLYAILASTFTIGKVLLSFVPPLFLIGLRMVFSGTVLLTGYYLFAKEKIKINCRDWLMLFVISLIHIFIPYTSEFIALQSIAPSCAALMFNLSPFFTAFFSYLYFSERMTPTKWLGALMSFSGLIYFVAPSSFCVGNIFDLNFSYPLLLVGVATSSLAWVIIRQFVKNKNYSIVFINGIAMLLGGIESFAASYLCAERVHFPSQNLNLFIGLFLTIFICANIFYNFYGYLLKKYSATFLSFMGIATPLITAFYDWLFLGMNIHSNFFITLILIGTGVYIFYKEELKQGYIVQ